MEWVLKEDPQTWKQLDVREMTPYILSQLMDGPYHSAAGCRADVVLLERPEHTGGSTFRVSCMYCDTADEHAERDSFVVIDMSAFRRITLMEVLRSTV